MKKHQLLDGLQRSTRTTIWVCVGFLGATVLILIFLMLFPLQKEEKVILTLPSSAQETQIATQEAVEFNWEDAPYTLSSWSAGIDGFYRSVEEYLTTEPETETETTEMTTAETQTEVNSDITTEEMLITDPPMPESETTVTVTVPPVETDPPEETIPEVTE